MELTEEVMCKLQQEDPILAVEATAHEDTELELTAEWMRKLQPLATKEAGLGGRQCEFKRTGFFFQGSLLVHRWSPKNSTSEEVTITLLILPTACRKMVMKLTFTIPLTGPTGKTKKPTDCILQ